MVAACPFPFSRGTPIRIFRMAEALSQRGHEINVFTYHLGNEANGAPFNIHRIPDIKTYRKYSPGPTYQKLFVLDLLLAIKLYKFIKQNKIDIIHAHNYEGLLISLFIRKYLKKPVIYDAHTLLESELPYYRLGFSKKFEKLIGLRLDRWLPKKADHIITVTDRIKTKLIQDSAANPENITTIMNGVEEDHFNIKLKDLNTFRDKKKILIFTGNLAPYQGIDLLLRVFQQVLYERQDVKLLIISDSSFEYYEPLAHALKIRKAIDVLQSDFSTLPKYLAQADIALNPRIDCDGFPQKLLNYMAAGKPIVSFESSGRNLIDGQTGLIAEDGNIPAFANAILKLLNNAAYANNLGNNAREFIISNYSWKNTAVLTEAVYEQVLSKKSYEKKILLSA
jgi:glycosyltransferase involved in cell wall biosynthesis